jgi:hypothetical protein
MASSLACYFESQPRFGYRILPNRGVVTLLYQFERTAPLVEHVRCSLLAMALCGGSGVSTVP